ncbi:hypothetical protein [Kribbella sp. NPDC051770]|uniref:hypothetical protein n=1 Tax=Kribbella sp. NPDC051770 TaxID=3155413 RepID=UPI003446F12F
MLKRSIALAGAAVLVTGLGGQAASAVPARAGAVTNVQVAWVNSEHTNLRITWNESAPAANTIVLRTDANEGGNEFGHTTAGQPNEYIVDSADLGVSGDPNDKVFIEVSDGSGTAGRTAYFDRFNYGGYPTTTSFEPNGSLRWTAGPDTSVDGTPDDPLDLPKVYSYAPQRREQTDDPSVPGCDGVNLPQTTTPTGTVPNPGHVYNLWMIVDNEWGAQPGPFINVGATKSITMTGPAATKLGEKTTLTGVLTGATLFESGRPPTCNEELLPLSNQTVVIQQRTSPTAAWTTAGSTKTDAQGKYTAVLTNPGHREYRVIRLNTTAGETAWYGGTGDSKAVRATTRVVSAKFINPVINLGTQPQAYLWVDPAGTQKAALQFKNASGAWQGVSYKTLYAGRGLLAFPWNKRGATQFRWWIPATTTADATYSGVFTLTVR